MTGKVICVINRKGGVGKTTLAIGLMDVLARNLARQEGDLGVVGVDLDPQSSLTAARLMHAGGQWSPDYIHALETGTRAAHGIIGEYLSGRRPNLMDVIFAGCGHINATHSLFATSFAAWEAERDLLRNNVPSADVSVAVGAFFDDLREKFRYVVVDCPPGQTLYSDGAIKHADMILCPLLPDWLSFWGLDAFEKYLQTMTADCQTPAYWIVNRYRSNAGRDASQTLVLEALEERFKDNADTRIDFIREAGSRGHNPPPIFIPQTVKIDNGIIMDVPLTYTLTRLLGFPESVGMAFNKLAAAVETELGHG